MAFKIVCYGVHPYEVPYFNDLNKYDYELTLLPEFLNHENADRAKGADALLLRGNCRADAENLKKFHDFGIKYVFTRTIGFDHIDLRAAGELDIRVARVPGYSAYSVAELAVTLAMTLNRHTAIAAQATSEGNFKVGKELFSKELNSSTVGIIGTGHIGLVEAEIWKSFGSKVLGYDIYQNENAKSILTYVHLEELLEQSDVISIHTPYFKDQNYHMISHSEIAKMKEGTVLINTARGELVDLEAVKIGIETGKLAGYGADVLENESGVFGHSFHSVDEIDDQAIRDVLHLYPRVLITPHMGSLTEPALHDMIAVSYDNFDLALAGKEVPNELKYQG